MRGAAGSPLAQRGRDMSAQIITFRAPESPDPGMPKRFPHKPSANVPPRGKPVPKPPLRLDPSKARLMFLLDQLAVAVGLDPAQFPPWKE